MLVTLSFLTSVLSRYAMVAEQAEMESSLKQFLKQYVEERSPAHDPDVRYAYSLIDLNQDGANEVIVHLVGRWLCGSGGCVTLVLEREEGSYRIISEISITRLPIRVLLNTSNGWRDIGVWVGGGGIVKGYEAVLCYDGCAYPSNPTLPPAKRIRGRTAGAVVIKSMHQARSLYP